MTREEYLTGPGRASSLPFWKTEQIEIPSHITVIRDDEFTPAHFTGTDEPFFKLIHDLRHIVKPELPAPFELVPCDITDFARHINECYTEESVSPEELMAYTQRPVYDPALWIAVYDPGEKQIAATGIGEIDSRIGEAIIEWIQVSPNYRRMGLGRYLVRELLYRMKDKAGFATVSGRLNNPCDPYDLYLSCGFTDPVIWHVVINKNR